MNRSSLFGGLALTGMGAALISVVVSGENLFYVRSNMTVPLVLAGGFMVVLGLAALTGVITPAHVPRSVIGVLVPICFVLLVRPGPLTVNTGATFDSYGSEPVMTSVVIPTSAIVGPDASADRVAEQAVTIDPGQFLFALDQFGDRFEGVALRMIGQVDHSDPEESRLVRFRIMCCAADARRLSVRLDGSVEVDNGAWVELTGQWDGNVDNPGLVVLSVTPIDQPTNPYLTP